jgi:heat shock protein HslJ
VEKNRRYPWILPGLLLFGLLSCRRAAPADPLAGTLWVATTCLGQKPVVGTTLTLSFEDGQVRGSSGCNTYFGSYQVSGSSVAVEQLASTKMACQEPGVMQQEAAFLASLSEAETYRLEEDRLEFVRTDGQTVVFEPGD